MKCARSWRQHFAYFPVRTLSRRLVWFRTVERCWNPMLNYCVIDAYDSGDYAGGWEYRLPLVRL